MIPLVRRNIARGSLQSDVEHTSRDLIICLHAIDLLSAVSGKHAVFKKYQTCKSISRTLRPIESQKSTAPQIRMIRGVGPVRLSLSLFVIGVVGVIVVEKW